jgi:hypothetical protein
MMSSSFFGLFSLKSMLSSLQDIDIEDKDDPQNVSEYVMEIFDYLKSSEIEHRVVPDYIQTKQKEIHERHRNGLVRWMGEAYVYLQLTSETLFLAVSLLDKVLSKRNVSKEKLHLVGLSCLFIASKYEENASPPLSDFLFCTDNKFQVTQIIEMERALLLKVFKFNINVYVNPLMFLRRYSKAAFSDTETHTLSKYICEASLASYHSLCYLPSMLSASSVLLARQLRQFTPVWTQTLSYYTDYEVTELMECASLLHDIIIAETASNGPFYRKYATSRFYYVSKIQLGDSVSFGC